jgi:hypothetical protein
MNKSNSEATLPGALNSSKVHGTPTAKRDWASKKIIKSPTENERSFDKSFGTPSQNKFKTNIFGDKNEMRRTH